ncbi:NnrS family protein [Labrenzia sp. DG1229]|uniref:NnrS family protein n=1 Tax=Labrenzia sp. DG1229 TaxID=681847 RepID=UPI0007C6C2EF|nr:NnrS family protein [Labrenzia sp. DG1229]
MAAALHSRDISGPRRFPTVLTAGFRFYFLSAGLFAVFSMLSWTIWLATQAAGGEFTSVPMAMAPHLWHAHEMLYGYTVAVMAGFFITAVPNWTGTREAGGVFVTVSGCVWMLGRLGIWFSGVFDPVAVAVVDLAFIPILSTAILGRLAKKSQARNMIFLFLLTALFLGNLLMHLDWIGWSSNTAEAGVRIGIFASAAMIAIVGGRVVPAFTRNALNREGHGGALPQSNAWLDRAGILLALLATLGSLPVVPAVLFGCVCFAAGGVNLVRLSGWRGWAVRKNPILWILHIAYLLLAVGYLLYGSTLLLSFMSETAALHLLAAGAIGSMTLAMMTRASLGHSGRPLKVSRSIALAYLLVIAAALVRSFGTLAFDYFPVMLVSGFLWTGAFALFAWIYFPILALPRPANRSD